MNHLRRQLIAAGLFLATPLTRAQSTGRTFRVGFVSAGARTPDGAPPGLLREALRGMGYS